MFAKCQFSISIICPSLISKFSTERKSFPFSHIHSFIHFYQYELMDSYFIEWFTIYYYFVVHIVLNGTNCQQELFQAGLCVLLTHPCDSFF